MFPLKIKAAAARLFLDHPKSVGESYFEHQRAAFSFAGSMICGGFACFIHGVIPGFYCRTGSRTVNRLHERMVANRTRLVETYKEPT